MAAKILGKFCPDPRTGRWAISPPGSRGLRVRTRPRGGLCNPSQLAARASPGTTMRNIALVPYVEADHDSLAADGRPIMASSFTENSNLKKPGSLRAGAHKLSIGNQLDTRVVEILPGRRKGSA